MSETITYLTDVALITCVVQSGDADDIVKAAKEAGATAALVYNGRGVGIRERLGLLGIAVDAEKDIVSILVSSDQREIVADRIYHAGHFDTVLGHPEQFAGCQLCRLLGKIWRRRIQAPTHGLGVPARRAVATCAHRIEVVNTGKYQCVVIKVWNLDIPGTAYY